MIMENTNDKTAVQMPRPAGYLYELTFDGHTSTAFTMITIAQPGQENRRAVFTQDQVDAVAAARAEEARREEAAIYDPIILDLRKEIARLALNATQRTAGGELVYQMRPSKGSQAGGQWYTTDVDGPTSIARNPQWADLYEFRTLRVVQPVAEAAAQAYDVLVPRKLLEWAQQNIDCIEDQDERERVSAEISKYLTAPTAQPTTEQQAEINAALDRADAEDAAQPPPDDIGDVHDRAYFDRALAAAPTAQPTPEFAHDMQMLAEVIPGPGPDGIHPSAAGRAKVVQAMAAQPTRQRYTCIGKGGSYVLLGLAKGSGTSKLLDDLMVYQDTATGALYFRTPDDFNNRMEVTL
jgi:hypothetical protein